MSGREKLVLNKKLIDKSAAYLKMWKVLESFDPNADRWAEPVSLGDRDSRIQAATDAISWFKERHPDAVEKELKGDIERFHEFLRSLSSGSPYDVEVDQFCWHLRRNLHSPTRVSSGPYRK